LACLLLLAARCLLFLQEEKEGKDGSFMNVLLPRGGWLGGQEAGWGGVASKFKNAAHQLRIISKFSNSTPIPHAQVAVMYGEHMQQIPSEYGSQAGILSAVVESLPTSGRSVCGISSTGESSSEATTIEVCYHTSRRSLLQALQLSQVLLSAVDKTIQTINDPEMMQGNGSLLAVEAMKARLLGFKEMARKSRTLEQRALNTLDNMRAPVTHETAGAGLPASGSGWMSLTEVGLLIKGLVSPQQIETECVLHRENAKF